MQVTYSIIELLLHMCIFVSTYPQISISFETNGNHQF